MKKATKLIHLDEKLKEELEELAELAGCTTMRLIKDSLSAFVDRNRHYLTKQPLSSTDEKSE